MSSDCVLDTCSGKMRDFQPIARVDSFRSKNFKKLFIKVIISARIIIAVQMLKKLSRGIKMKEQKCQALSSQKLSKRSKMNIFLHVSRIVFVTVSPSAHVSVSKMQ